MMIERREVLRGFGGLVATAVLGKFGASVADAEALAPPESSTRAISVRRPPSGIRRQRPSWCSPMSAGHGYSVVSVRADRMEVEFVCIPAPLERSPDADGGPLAYRVAHQVKLWGPGETPRVERTRSEGTLPLVL